MGPVYNWVAKQGSIIIFADNEKVHFEINTENNPSCLLTKNDAEDVIDILTDVSGAIWESPGYLKEPYNGKLYRLDENGRACWETEEAKLFIGLNDQQDALEIKVVGNPVMKLPVNLSIEIVQVMTHFSNRLS